MNLSTMTYNARQRVLIFSQEEEGESEGCDRFDIELFIGVLLDRRKIVPDHATRPRNP